MEVNLFGTNIQEQDINSRAPVDPPALRVTPRDKVTQKRQQKSGMEDGLLSLGRGLGNALAEFVAEDKKTTQEQQIQETIARQGLDKAVNVEDAKLKRTGWGLKLYGQNPQYAVAQELATQNNITDEAMKFEATIDQYATMHPDVFRETVLNKQLESIVEPFGTDVEMRQKMSAVWNKRVPSIVKHQYQSWYANSQKQAYEGAKQQILKESDVWTQGLNIALSNGDTEDLMAIHTESRQFLETGKPTGMTDEAWRRATLEATHVSLSNGNKNLYDRLKEMKYLDNMTAAEQNQIQAGLSQYDVNYERQVNTLWTDFEEQLYDIDDIQDGYAVIDSFKGELKALESRKSGTERSELAYQRGERNAARWGKKLDNELKRGLTRVAKQQVERQDKERLIDSFNLPTLDRESYQAVHTEKDVKEAFDSFLMGSLGEQFDLDTSSPETVMASVIRNPEQASFLAKKLKDQTQESPMVKHMLGAFSSGWQNMVGENGKLNEDGLMMYQSMTQLKKSGVLDRYLNSTVMKDADFVLTRLDVGMPPAAIEKDMLAYKQSSISPKADVFVEKGQTQYEAELKHVNAIVQEVRKDSLNRQEQVKLRERFLEGLRIYNNDTDAATEYVKTRFVSDAAIVNGSMVFIPEDVKKFPVKEGEKDSYYNLETVLNNAGGSNNLLHLYVENGQGVDFGERANVNFKDIVGLTVHGTPDEEGIYIDAPSFTMAQFIPKHVLQSWAEKLASNKSQKMAVEAAELLRTQEREQETKLPKY